MTAKKGQGKSTPSLLNCSLLVVISILVILLLSFLFSLYRLNKRVQLLEQGTSLPQTGSSSDLYVLKGDADAVETVMILDKSIVNKKLANDSVTTQKIKNGTILLSDL
ncbi:unnamed protein product, partial [marine sediment metagenome]